MSSKYGLTFTRSETKLGQCIIGLCRPIKHGAQNHKIFLNEKRKRNIFNSLSPWFQSEINRVHFWLIHRAAAAKKWIWTWTRRSLLWCKFKVCREQPKTWLSFTIFWSSLRTYCSRIRLAQPHFSMNSTLPNTPSDTYTFCNVPILCCYI